MGATDHYVGSCPKCNKQIGYIQTKTFWPQYKHCDREFKPGSTLPFAPPKYVKKLHVGTTICTRWFRRAEKLLSTDRGL